MFSIIRYNYDKLVKKFIAYLSLSVNSVIKCDNIFMIHLLQQFDLFNHTSLSLIISQLILIIYLHSHVER
jgi:hypothetical protein